jgi:hypothetical protein
MREGLAARAASDLVGSDLVPGRFAARSAFALDIWRREQPRPAVATSVLPASNRFGQPWL